jgi:hypothetical protein
MMPPTLPDGKQAAESRGDHQLKGQRVQPMSPADACVYAGHSTHWKKTLLHALPSGQRARHRPPENDVSPVRHGEQPDDPWMLENDDGQLVQLPPALENVPAGHGKHEPPENADDPASHGVHSSPDTDEWPGWQLRQRPPGYESWPAGHLVHTPPKYELQPGSHGEQTPSTNSVLPRPSGHGSHRPDDRAVEPGTHLVHEPPCTDEKPALQATQLVCVSSDVRPAGHGKHT